MIRHRPSGYQGVILNYPSEKLARRVVLRASGIAAIVLIAVGIAAASGSGVLGATSVPLADASASADASATADRDDVVLDPRLFGHSGKLRMRVVSPAHPLAAPIASQLFGDSALAVPAVRLVPAEVEGGPFALVTLVPFSEKQGATLGSYRIGFWSAERRAPSNSMYAAPVGFIKVTRENQDTHVSENFRLRDFLTKDQTNVWPKYLVLREELVDKLELIIQDLRGQGINVTRMHVMSGFRTPQYNNRGVGAGGRASESRHTYGDAADVFVDNNGNGRMDDLNGDGRIDHRDAQVILDAAARVERKFPDLVGGHGLYRANASHGPFAHVDVRGQYARWGN
jgi:hypothetical protein